MEIQRIRRSAQRASLWCMRKSGICPMKACLRKGRNLGIPFRSIGIRHSIGRMVTPDRQSWCLPLKSPSLQESFELFTSLDQEKRLLTLFELL